MTDSEHGWILLIFLVLLDVVLFYLWPLLAFLGPARDFIVLVMAVFNIFMFVVVML